MAVELKHVNRKLGDFQIRDLTFSLPEGSILGIVGRNGAGKSTMIKLMLGLLKRDSGEIVLNGEFVDVLPANTAEEIGVVFDEPVFPEELTLLEIAGVLKDLYQNWDQTLFESDLKKFDLPEDQPFKAFSRGMKMKAMIITALSHHPKILILDEPTSGLDPVVRDEMVELFFEFTREEDHTILISSHIVSDLERLCDYILFIRNGKIELFEEKDRLLDRYGILSLTEDQVEDLPEGSICGIRRTAYQTDVLVDREMTAGWDPPPATLEDIYLFTEKAV